jgi:hypothetical protein
LILVGDAAGLAHGRGEARLIGAELYDNFHLRCRVAALSDDGGAQSMGGSFATFHSIIDKGVLELMCWY